MKERVTDLCDPVSERVRELHSVRECDLANVERESERFSERVRDRVQRKFAIRSS